MHFICSNAYIDPQFETDEENIYFVGSMKLLAGCCKRLDQIDITPKQIMGFFID